ncbi:MAG: 50S ribosomal protein L21 [Candidatus Omnitrophica bacterium]|nr:50S ribosomal protein L21 [Candidatus Omnitrophota bacterium]
MEIACNQEEIVMYAIIDLQGTQVKVEKDSVFEINRFRKESPKSIKVSEVLFAEDNAKHYIGTPYVKGAYVECEVLEEKRGPKVIAFKYRDRKGSQSKKGHRQDLVELKVKEIHLA